MAKYFRCVDSGTIYVKPGQLVYVKGDLKEGQGIVVATFYPSGDHCVPDEIPYDDAQKAPFVTVQFPDDINDKGNPRTITYNGNDLANLKVMPLTPTTCDDFQGFIGKLNHLPKFQAIDALMTKLSG